MKKILAFFLLITLGIVSCKSGSTEKEAAIRVVKGYTTALPQAYRDGDAKYLAPFASSQQMSYISLNIIDYDSQNRVFVCRIDELKIKDVRKSEEGGAEELLVDTEEKWTFWMEETGTGTLVVPQSKINYRITYHLGKREKSWIIEKMDLKAI